MAIIDRGEILLEAEPLRAVDGAAGPDLAARDREGRAARAGARARGDLDEAPRGPHRRARLQRRAPGAGFEPVEPDLEDVYFSTMAGHHDGSRATALAALATAASMKFCEIFRFELAYQVRRPRPGSTSRSCSSLTFS